MNVVVIDEQDGGGEPDDPPSPQPLRRLAELVLTGEGVPDGATVTITLVAADRMAALNGEHMAGTGPTDVLSFPIEDLVAGSPPVADPDGPPVDLGDVVVCPAVVHANAAGRGVRFDDEMALMVVHGLLHLLGYDHVDDSEAEHMEDRERSYLAEVGRRRP